VIRAVTRKGIEAHGWEVLGFQNGWQGPLEGLTRPIGLDDVEDILARGGRFSVRREPTRSRWTAVWTASQGARRQRRGRLVAIGGEDTLGVAKRLTDEASAWSACPRPSTTT